MSKQAIVYIETGFLYKYFDEVKKPYKDINSQYLTFIDTLIFEKSTIYLDLSCDELLQILQTNDNPKYAVGIRSLSMVNKIISTHHKIKEFLSNINFIENLEFKPNYILADVSNEQARYYSSSLGIICLSSDFNKHKNEFIKTIIKPLPTQRKIFFSSIFKTLPQPKDVIIEDPYFFTQSIEFLKDFVLGFSNTIMKRNPIRILIITSTQKVEEDKKVQKLKDNFKNISDVSLEVVIRPSNENHDRHVYANTFWISSLSSFRENYSKKTVIDIHPIGLYYAQFYDKLSYRLKFYNKGSYKFENGLINLI